MLVLYGEIQYQGLFSRHQEQGNAHKYWKTQRTVGF
jgi:hypothetical protein